MSTLGVKTKVVRAEILHIASPWYQGLVLGTSPWYQGLASSWYQGLVLGTPGWGGGATTTTTTTKTTMQEIVPIREVTPVAMILRTQDGRRNREGKRRDLQMVRTRTPI